MSLKLLITNLKQETKSKPEIKGNNIESKNILSFKKKYNYVINLNRRKDRWDNFLNKIKGTSLEKEDFIRIEAFDALFYQKELIRLSTNNFVLNLFKLFKKNNISFMKPGELGCLLSHVITLQEIIKNENINEDEYVTIYEDDFEYCENFEKNYEILKNIKIENINVDFIYIGGRNSKNFNIKHKLFMSTTDDNLFFRQNNFSNIDRYNYDRGTFSYIVKKSSCNKILNNIKGAIENNVKLIAIDHIYTKNMKEIQMFDFLPHLYYSTLIVDSDVQKIIKPIHF